MEGLRWWLLLLTALMFSMSGCATQEWTVAREAGSAGVVLVLERDPR